MIQIELKYLIFMIHARIIIVFNLANRSNELNVIYFNV